MVLFLATSSLLRLAARPVSPVRSEGASALLHSQPARGRLALSGPAFGSRRFASSSNREVVAGKSSLVMIAAFAGQEITRRGAPRRQASMICPAARSADTVTRGIEELMANQAHSRR